MNELLVSKYENSRSKTCVHTGLLKELENIKTGKYKELISPCRKAINSNEIIIYKALKEKLPVITFCGPFNNEHKASNIISYNKLLIVDIDDLKKEEVTEFKKKIESDIHTLAVFLSPSGLGLKILVKIETEGIYHKLAFRAIVKYYKETFDINVDTSGSDLSRLCYVSWDPELYLNKNSEIFKYNAEEIIATENNIKPKINGSNRKSSLGDSINLKISFGLNDDYDRKVMKRIITFLRKNGKSITSTHDKWYKCAYAIANTFSYDVGEKYFLALSRLDGDKFDEYKCKKIINYCYINRKDEGGIHFKTIIFFAKEQGFKLFQSTSIEKHIEINPLDNNAKQL